PLGGIVGSVTEAGTSTPVAGAKLTLQESGLSAVADSNGTYTLQDTAGPKTLGVTAFGFSPASQPVTINVGTTAPVSVALNRLPGAAVEGQVLDGQTALPVPGATVQILGTPLVQASDAGGAYALGAVPAGTYTVQTFAFGYNRPDLDLTVNAGQDETLDVVLSPGLQVEDFEIANAGWTVTGDATTGMWERGDPQATFEGTEMVQPEDDHTPAGTDAWITGLAAGAVIGQYDVDNGITVLTSPVVDLTGAVAPRVTYRRWYSTGLGNPTTDVFSVEASSDGGSSWVTLESTGQRQTEWALIDRAVADLVVPTAQVRFRFTARDTGVGSITEAGIDDFMVYDTAGAVGTTAPPLGPDGPPVQLSAGFPNPFRAADGTRFALALPSAQRVEAAVYDVHGRRVASLQRGRLPAGPHQIHWDGRTTHGTAAAAGVYFLKLRSVGGSESRKIVLLR
ncbi:MAG: T9SS type A sorting domain-containing protein, partial [Gemmatimonadetes bacterium]|nr:T9SS type A sorting domain-containing protein [Gemmatimonadota bacterium]